MPRILALFAIFMLGCSSTVYGVTGAPGAGAGGEAAATTGGSAGSVAATGGQSGATSSAGAPSVGGQGTAGSAAAGGGGAPAGSTHVDVVPGVQTDCVFPSEIVMPPLVPDVCQNISVNGLCMKCTGDCTLPFTFTNLVWDYSTMTLTFDVNNNSHLYTMEQGSCGGTSTSCTYNVFMGDPSFSSSPAQVVFQKTDRGYVGWSVDTTPSWGHTSDSCSADSTAESAQMNCVRSGWTDYWRNLLIPCGK